jgi:hypothetical protein
MRAKRGRGEEGRREATKQVYCLLFALCFGQASLINKRSQRKCNIPFPFKFPISNAKLPLQQIPNSKQTRDRHFLAVVLRIEVMNVEECDGRLYYGLQLTLCDE